MRGVNRGGPRRRRRRGFLVAVVLLLCLLLSSAFILNLNRQTVTDPLDRINPPQLLDIPFVAHDVVSSAFDTRSPIPAPLEQGSPKETNDRDTQNEEQSSNTPPPELHRPSKHPRFPQGDEVPTPVAVDISRFSSRQLKVRESMRKVWSSYKRHAFPRDELLPLSGRGWNWGDENNSTRGISLSALEALDTLHILGLPEEVSDILHAFHPSSDASFRSHETSPFSHNIDVSVFELTIRGLGGLLGGYEVTGELALLDLAYDLGLRLLGAFPQYRDGALHDLKLQSGHSGHDREHAAHQANEEEELPDPELAELAQKGVHPSRRNEEKIERYERHHGDQQADWQEVHDAHHFQNQRRRRQDEHRALDAKVAKQFLEPHITHAPERTEDLGTQDYSDIFPFPTINLKTLKVDSPSYLSPRNGRLVRLSEVTGIQLEFAKLSSASGDMRFHSAAQSVMHRVLRLKNTSDAQFHQPATPELDTEKKPEDLFKHESWRAAEQRLRRTDKRNAVHGLELPQDLGTYLFTELVECRTGLPDAESPATVGAKGDSFYEYLLKQSILFGAETRDKAPQSHLRRAYSTLLEEHLLTKMLVEVTIPHHGAERIRRNLRGTSLSTARAGLTAGTSAYYFRRVSHLGEPLRSDGMVPASRSEIDEGLDDPVEHLSCFVAGLLILGDVVDQSTEHYDVAHGNLKTCLRMYLEQPTLLGPEWVSINSRSGIISAVKGREQSLLRPELFESLFYANRGRPKSMADRKLWEDVGWTLFEHLAASAEVVLPNCFGEGCATFAALANVRDPKEHLDRLDTFVFSETFKYLFLLFEPQPSTSFPLEEWVFTTEGHPLRKLSEVQRDRLSRAPSHNTGRHLGNPSLNSKQVNSHRGRNQRAGGVRWSRKR